MSTATANLPVKINESNSLADLAARIRQASKASADVTKNAKGYLKDQFKDAFARYLPAFPLQAVTPSQVGEINDLQDIAAVTNDFDVTSPSPSNPLKNNECDGVTAPQGVESETRASRDLYAISRNPEDRRPPAISSGPDDDLNDFV
jgi:hypothetical protein